SFLQFADELHGLARERLGVADVVVFDPATRIGTPEAESGKVVEFARGIDAAVGGLGTGGACTAWSVHGTIVCERPGRPAAVVVTAVFENLARTAARAQGYPDLRMLVLPHPMEARPESDVRAIARERFAALIALIAEEG